MYVVFYAANLRICVFMTCSILHYLYVTLMDPWNVCIYVCNFFTLQREIEWKVWGRAQSVCTDCISASRIFWVHVLDYRQIAPDMGFTLIKADCTSYFSALAMRNLGARCVFSMKYADYCAPDSDQPVFQPEYPHTAVQTFVQTVPRGKKSIKGVWYWRKFILQKVS